MAVNSKYRRILPEIRGLVDFSSNDYLGLARSDIFSGSPDGAHGSTGSRLLTGNSEEAMHTEAYLADHWSQEGVLIFPSGYMANLGLLSAVPGRHDTILYDSLSHACIKDGVRLSLANGFSFRHNDLNHLESRLKNASGQAYVVVESVYSMDGDQAPLKEIQLLCQQFEARLIIDEAHATGLAGIHGGGISEADNIEFFARVNTFGKAVGLHGASVSGSAWLKDFLVNNSRPFIYTTAPPPHLFVQIRKAFDFLKSHPELAVRLYNNISYFHQKSGAILNERVMPGPHAVQAVLIPGEEPVRNAAATVQAAGYDVRPILPPTVQEGTERLRICLHSYNTKEQMDGLLTILKTLL
ncbi:aminotransferase class I/II-fold pyridoxal phosphate-dependent enzyme [Fulvivirga sedimenti]|uniref:Aminotransferase class I/II-fold pyridoxal phosphate-dependent enzyme n=1 Tax=Fulvivirga sedimenti TaxID=2879465 RepID=A0A9X1L1X5_9BACT|nr:aminotransferase class I/II-fold pyridoxal phosphate-dependent enzyme [Fulvivirga sedimenti]MCA6079129.1 aminotransferase class I/II-fold pyridoxal phosphate-dependent enzyme [Fulvivirga sedimenti]